MEACGGFWYVLTPVTEDAHIGLCRQARTEDTGQTDRRADRTDKQDRQTDRQTDRTDKQDRQTDRQGKLAGRKSPPRFMQIV